MSKTYGVKLVRGPVLRLEPHPTSCDTVEELYDRVRTMDRRLPRAVDLFCGAGGLSIGLERAGYQVILGVDKDAEALETHRSLAPGLSVDWDLGDARVIEQVAAIVRDLDVELLAGGPPCQPFSKAGRSMLRHLVRDGRREAHDRRRDLWQSFLEVVRLSRPPAVLMENVPDMALDRDILILRTMVDELEALGYGVEERLVETWRYGVPQFRQRLILVALRDGVRFEWPQEVPSRVSVRQAISDLPAVEGGWRPSESGQPYLGPRSAFQKEMRRRVPREEADVIFDHITRPVREDDALAFAQMDSKTKYSDLPDELKRYRDDIFDDKYKRLDWDELGRTITAHIAKDGYWYIHPEQDRTLTVREAARIQTFPDHVRFAGSPTAAFRQIGNAVPPMLGRALGGAIRTALAASGAESAVSTRDVSRMLSLWLRERASAGEVGTPWHAAAAEQLLERGTCDLGLRWPVLLAHVLLDRVPLETARALWPAIQSRFPDPPTLLAREVEVRAIAFAAKRERQADRALEIARHLGDSLEPRLDLAVLESLPVVSRSLARSTCRLVPGEDADPIEAPGGLLRVTARFWGSSVDVENKRSDGRLAVARLIGVDYEDADQPHEHAQGALAYLALLEVAEHVCRPAAPRCGQCPLSERCIMRPELESAQQELAV
jgi:DNA (cytosine-5)-methyltransferase 1